MDSVQCHVLISNIYIYNYIFNLEYLCQISEGNNDSNYDPLDICFGGRRKFVGGSYVDFGKCLLRCSHSNRDQRNAKRLF